MHQLYDLTEAEFIESSDFGDILDAVEARQGAVRGNIASVLKRLTTSMDEALTSGKKSIKLAYGRFIFIEDLGEDTFKDSELAELTTELWSYGDKLALEDYQITYRLGFTDPEMARQLPSLMRDGKIAKREVNLAEVLSNYGFNRIKLRAEKLKDYVESIVIENQPRNSEGVRVDLTGAEIGEDHEPILSPELELLVELAKPAMQDRIKMNSVYGSIGRKKLEQIIAQL